MRGRGWSTLRDVTMLISALFNLLLVVGAQSARFCHSRAAFRILAGAVKITLFHRGINSLCHTPSEGLCHTSPEGLQLVPTLFICTDKFRLNCGVSAAAVSYRSKCITYCCSVNDYKID